MDVTCAIYYLSDLQNFRLPFLGESGPGQIHHCGQIDTSNGQVECKINGGFALTY